MDTELQSSWRKLMFPLTSKGKALGMNTGERGEGNARGDVFEKLGPGTPWAHRFYGWGVGLEIWVCPNYTGGREALQGPEQKSLKHRGLFFCQNIFEFTPAAQKRWISIKILKQKESFFEINILCMPFIFDTPSNNWKNIKNISARGKIGIFFSLRGNKLWNLRYFMYQTAANMIFWVKLDKKGENKRWEKLTKTRKLRNFP